MTSSEVGLGSIEDCLDVIGRSFEADALPRLWRLFADPKAARLGAALVDVVRSIVKFEAIQSAAALAGSPHTLEPECHALAAKLRDMLTFGERRRR